MGSLPGPWTRHGLPSLRRFNHGCHVAATDDRRALKASLTCRCRPHDKHHVKKNSMRICVGILLVLGMLLYVRHGEGRRLGVEIAELQKRIAEPRIPVISMPISNESTRFDWQETARNWPAFGDDYGTMKAYVRMRHALQHLSAEELAAAVDDLAAADISGYLRESFGTMLVEPLAQLDPELALKKSIHVIRDTDGGALHTLSVALEHCARRDPSAATAWFDHEVAAGTFMSRNLEESYPSIFEMRLINGLIDTDPAAARKRIMLLPEDKRDSYLGFLGDKMRSHTAYAALVRGSLTEGSNRAFKIARPAGDIFLNEGYAGVTEYIREINASPAEQQEIIRSALRAPEIHSAEDIQAMRAWVMSHQAEDMDELVGEQLSFAVPRRPGLPGISFDHASEIAKNSGSESLLAAFLQSHTAQRNPEQARELAQLINDAALRDRVLSRLK